MIRSVSEPAIALDSPVAFIRLRLIELMPPVNSPSIPLELPEPDDTELVGKSRSSIVAVSLASAERR